MPARRMARSVPRKLAALRLGFSGELRATAAALAVVGFGQIDQFEVEGEGAAQLVGLCRPAWRMRRGPPAGAGSSASLHRSFGQRFAAPDGGLAQLFDLLVELVAGLLAQHAPSSIPSERTSRRSGASFSRRMRASSSARRSVQLSGFQKRSIRICIIAGAERRTFLRRPGGKAFPGYALAAPPTARSILPTRRSAPACFSRRSSNSRETRAVSSALTKTPRDCSALPIEASRRGISSSTNLRRSCICFSLMGFTRRAGSLARRVRGRGRSEWLEREQRELLQRRLRRRASSAPPSLRQR